MKGFEQINKGYNSIFEDDCLSIGIVVPIENYSQSSIPTMKNHIKRVELVERLGFKALWLRDVPFNVPAFGDAGQMYDPFTYLGFLAAKTTNIALGISSIALPLHHPVHVAKSVATIDQLSEGRLILGVASGDRYDEYPGMGIDYEKRSELFRESFDYIRQAQNSFPKLETSHYGNLKGNIDILPKVTAHKIPMLITGYSQQTLKWNADNGDGWMYYPRNINQQQLMIEEWRKQIELNNDFNKPFMQPLYIDLNENNDFKPQPIHLGLKIGANHLIEYLSNLKKIGVNHVSLNLRLNTRNIEETLEQISQEILPHFHSLKKEDILR